MEQIVDEAMDRYVDIAGVSPDSFQQVRGIIEDAVLAGLSLGPERIAP